MPIFPSRKDDYDAGLWKHFSHLLATQAGIDAAITRTIATGDKYHTLLSRRFDRNEEGKRIHFASAMTLLGLTDGDNASTGHGYLDIVDFIIQSCANVEANLHELYRRVAFNICISPAYDMNPTLNERQSLLISASSCDSDLNILLDASEDYMINRKMAIKIIYEVCDVVKNGRVLAIKLGIPKREMELFAQKFDKTFP